MSLRINFQKKENFTNHTLNKILEKNSQWPLGHHWTIGRVVCLLPSRMGFLAFGLDVRFAMPRIATTMLALVSLTNLRNQVLTLVPSSGDTSWMEAQWLVEGFEVGWLVGWVWIPCKKNEGLKSYEKDAGASNDILGFVRVIGNIGRLWKDPSSWPINTDFVNQTAEKWSLVRFV